MQETSLRTASHQIILQDRCSLEMTGVSDLASFDENTVIATTSMGDLTIRGHNLNVRLLDLDSGLLTLEGKVEEMSYSESVHGNWLSRLLR